MKILTDQELKGIEGGAIKWGTVGLLLIGLTAFMIGVIDGYKRPIGCRAK